MHRDPRLSLTKIIVGVLSLLLLLLSVGTIPVTYHASAMAEQPDMQNPMSTGQIASIHTGTITSLPTLIDTPSPTDTPTDTPTPTSTPSPTATSTPSPTPTNTPLPKPTHTPVPKPTSTPPSSPVATATSLPYATATPLPHVNTTPGAHGTPGANTSGTPATNQGGGGQNSTPTDSSTGSSTSGDYSGQNTSPGVRGSSFPAIDVFGGVLCSITFLFLLFIGWQRLRKYLLPMGLEKLPPSGAPPWSREWTDNSMNNNQEFMPTDLAFNNGYGPATSPITPPQGIAGRLSVSQTVLPYQNYAGPPPSYGMETLPGGQLAPYGYPEARVAGNFAITNGNFAPATDASFPPVTDGFTVLPRVGDPERAIPFNAPTSMFPMNNDNGALPVAPPVINGPWTGSPTNAGPDVNDPYLLEMIRQYREKDSASGRPMGQP